MRRPWEGRRLPRVLRPSKLAHPNLFRKPTSFGSAPRTPPALFIREMPFLRVNLPRLTSAEAQPVMHNNSAFSRFLRDQCRPDGDLRLQRRAFGNAPDYFLAVAVPPGGENAGSACTLASQPPDLSASPGGLWCRPPVRFEPSSVMLDLLAWNTGHWRNRKPHSFEPGPAAPHPRMLADHRTKPFPHGSAFLEQAFSLGPRALWIESERATGSSLTF
ncbi:hypothetical protein VTO73DRAFT_7956 [Trametes versicolor]